HAVSGNRRSQRCRSAHETEPFARASRRFRPVHGKPYGRSRRDTTRESSESPAHASLRCTDTPGWLNVKPHGHRLRAKTASAPHPSNVDPTFHRVRSALLQGGWLVRLPIAEHRLRIDGRSTAWPAVPFLVQEDSRQTLRQTPAA